MKEILSGIFKMNDFTMYKIGSSDYYVNNKKLENYLVYYIDDFTSTVVENILEENLYDIEFCLIKEDLNKEMQKNTSVIFLVKVEDSNLNENEKKLIFKIEEDPYFYKKYVLWYSKNEIENIMDYTNQMTENLMNKELFNKMKDAMREEIEYDFDIHAYTLLCRMFIKLPFLTLKPIYSEEDELHKLKQNIHNKLSKYGDLYKELSCDFTNLDIEMNEDDIDTYINIIESDIKI